MARSSAALRHPPAPVPSAPAGDFAGKAGPVHGEVQDQSGLLGAGVEKQRRRGRGTLVQCVRPLRAGRPHRLRRRLAEPGRTAAVQDQCAGGRDPQGHHPQQFSGHFLRPLDQSLSRLRAWLRLLLRAADPRLSRAVAGARFRIQAVHEAGRGALAGARIVGARLFAAHHRDRHQYRSVSADREAIRDHAPHPRKCWSAPVIRSASSPNRRW